MAAPATQHPEVERFLKYIEAERRYSPLTVRNYRSDLERFFAWADVRDPLKITREDISAWIIHRTETERIGARSMNRELCTLRSFYRYLQQTDAIDRDLFHAIPALKTPRRLPEFVPDTRMREVVGECDEKSETEDFISVRDGLIVMMFYTCGLRLSELVGIDVEDFSADYASLRVRGKGDKERMVPVLEFVREKIIRYRGIVEAEKICKSDEKALFLSQKGDRISRMTVYRVVKRELDAGGVQGKCSPHVLRHTFATHLMDGGADMREIQELLGHASLQATQVYTHNSIARLQKVYRTAHPRGDDNDK